MARAIRNAIRANRFARIDSRESFAIETPIFIARQADSQESLEFPIRAISPDSRESCESIRANHATKAETNRISTMKFAFSKLNCHGFPKQRFPLKTLTSLNKEVRPFFLSDNSIWSFPSVSSLGDYSIWRS